MSDFAKLIAIDVSDGKFEVIGTHLHMPLKGVFKLD